MYKDMTEDEKGVVIAVTQVLIAMLENNVIAGYGTETFEGWCENGAIFDEDGRDACIELMHKVAPVVDELTYNYLNLGY